MVRQHGSGWRPWGDHPLVVTIGMVVALIAIIGFITGKQNLSQILSSSSSDQIDFSRAHLACERGLDATPMDNGEKLLLTWRDADVNTYCGAEGPYPASGVQRLVVRVSNLDLPGAHPSFKVDAEGVHLPLADPADGNPELVDAPWARLRPGDLGFVLPESVVQDKYVSNFRLTFHNVRHGSLQVAVFLRPLHFGRLPAANWPILLGIALAGGIGLMVAWVRTQHTRIPVDLRPGKPNARKKVRGKGE